jgi:hypothetical protein
MVSRPSAGRGDVEEGDLVGALLVVAARHLDRVAGIADVDEAHALDDPAGVDVQAGDDARASSHLQAVRRWTARRPGAGGLGEIQRALVDGAPR